MTFETGTRRQSSFFALLTFLVRKHIKAFIFKHKTLIFLFGQPR